jgi:putative ABC transport system ATP-binding protein
MAVLVRPHVLVLDEHCAALDPRTAAAIMEATIGEIRSNGITTLMVTHNMQHAIAHGDRLLMMHEGRVLFEATGSDKAGLTVESLVSRFHLVNDQLLLSM